MLIAMTGLPGTGKSTLARALAEALPAIVLNKDEIRAVLFPPPWIEYSTSQDDFCVDVMFQVATYHLRKDPTRHVILDGRTYSRRYQRAALIRAAAAIPVPLKVILCVCADATAIARLEQDRAADNHPAKNRDAALYHAVKARYAAWTHPRLTVDTGQSLDDCVAQCLAYLH